MKRLSGRQARKAVDAVQKFGLQVRALSLTAENDDVSKLLDYVVDGYEASIKEATGER
jgi:hypothetical protein